MPFRPPSPSDGPLAKVDCLAEKDPVTVREDHLADVELVAVAVSDPQKVRYGGLAEKEGVDEGSRVGRLRRTTEAALVKTWSYELAATTRYKGVGEAMRVEGGGLRRTVEDFQWCRLALVAEHATLCQPIDIGRQRLRVPTQATNPIVEIVDGDKQNVGRLFSMSPRHLTCKLR